MAKAKTAYVCSSCGATFLGWLGKCPQCGEWNTLVRRPVEGREERGRPRSVGRVVSLANVLDEEEARIPVPVDEVSRVLGGGFVPGSVVLLAGAPGIGKSTLVLQICMCLAREGRPVLYISGEESARQIGMRAKRLIESPPELHIFAEPAVEAMIEEVGSLEPALVVVDSIQSVYLESRSSMAGSITQVRDSAAALSRMAKETGIPLVLVGHVTKAGAIAGPRVLEHMVDVVLYMEGDRFHAHRLLRSVKNRYGSTNEVGVFEMTQTGLRQVSNPSEAFLAERLIGVSGSAVAVTMEGTRPILVEVQALTSQALYGNVRRTANGFDYRRLLLITAVLSRRAGIALGQQDVFVNVVGGMQLNEPAADMGVAMAIASSALDRPLPADMAFVGEVGLSGEVRSVAQLERRVAEAARLGFAKCMVPRSYGKSWRNGEECEVLPVRTVAEGVRLLRG